jgi:hypothetical protein
MTHSMSEYTTASTATLTSPHPSNPASPRTRNSMHARIASSAFPLLTLTASAFLAGDVHANLLANAGFETTAFTASSNVLGNFVGNQGTWGILAGGITPATAGVTPCAGTQMLCMVGAGQLSTITVQAVDVSSFTALIASGNAQLNASALLNTNGGYTGANARLRARFFSGPMQSTFVGSTSLANLILDANPSTWEQASVSAMIPVNTTWIVYEVNFNGPSLAGNTGFVDEASMTITAVPAPGAIVLVGLAGLSRRRSRMRL